MQDRVHNPPLYPPAVTPSRRALPLLLFLGRFVRNPLRALPRAVYEQPIVTYGRKRPLVTWVTDPELIERILLKDAAKFTKTRLEKRILVPVVGNGLLSADGEHWRWQRKLASPLFRHSEVIGFCPKIVAAAHEQVARWKTKGQRFTSDVLLDMTETTFAVIARTVLAGINEQEGAAIQKAGHDYLEPISWELAATLLMPTRDIWHPGQARMRKAAKETRDIVQRLLDQRRAAGTDGDDLVARMLTVRRESGEPMSDAELVDNLGTFLLAGHETTAKALTWTLYLLARAPEWQERARHEIMSVTGGANVTPAHIAKLEITTRILKESMRLYPPVPVMTRVNTEDIELGGKFLPKPTLVVIPIYSVHRHKLLWTDPDRFDPDRFLPENEAKFPRAQFMPFGFGQRVCIGSTFAMLEALAVLATLLQHARFDWDGRHFPEPVSRVTLRPKGGMPLIVTAI